MKEHLRMSPTLTGADGIAVSVGRITSFPVHSHSYYEMILYPSFSGEVTVNSVPVSSGSEVAVLMTPNDVHRIEYAGEPPAKYIKVAFTEDVLGGYLARRLSCACILPVTAETSAVTFLFDRIASVPPREERVILLRALVLEILNAGSPVGGAIRTPQGSFVAAATAIIGDEFTEELTLKALAARLNVSHQHLSACFSKSTGLSFSAYLADVRLRHAKALLAGTDESITEICYACGYRSLSHFLRAFKKKFGVTPREYRKGTRP